MTTTLAGVVAGCAAVPTGATGVQTRATPATVGAEAQIAALAAILARHASATAALEEWCQQNRFADAPRIVAHRLPASGETIVQARQHLRLRGDTPIGVRHVELACGTRVLSVAHNVYNPALLSPAMNAALAATDVPFGKVVAPLGFTRETIDQRRGGEPGCPAGTVLSQVALLRLPDGQPLAFLTECYTRAAVE